MEKSKGPTLLDVAEALAALITRVDLMDKKIEADLASVGENIVTSIFRLAEALQSRVSDLERSDAARSGAGDDPGQRRRLKNWSCVLRMRTAPGAIANPGCTRQSGARHRSRHDR